MKADPDLKNIGKNVRRIRENKKKDLMLELHRSEESEAEHFRSQAYLVKNQTDLNEFTSKAENC